MILPATLFLAWQGKPAPPGVSQQQCRWKVFSDGVWDHDFCVICVILRNYEFSARRMRMKRLKLQVSCVFVSRGRGGVFRSTAPGRDRSVWPTHDRSADEAAFLGRDQALPFNRLARTTRGTPGSAPQSESRAVQSIVGGTGRAGGGSRACPASPR